MAVPAGVLALLAAALLGSFALWSLVYAAGSTGGWSAVTVVDVFGGIVSAAVLVVVAGFAFARRIWAAWTLAALCVVHTLATLASPLLLGTSMTYQLTWLFTFQKPNGVLMGLALVFSVLTAITSAAGAIARHRAPATAPPPPRP